jgi:hypothetical protein
MKRGAWLAIAIFLINIPFALAARDSLSHVLFGTGVSDDFLLRMIYFALVFTIFFKLSKDQMFKKDKEKKFAVIISLCFGLIVMWFTPAALLNNFKWLILLIGPFALVYIITGFFIKDKKSDEGKTKFNLVRLILAIVITGLLFLLLSGSPGFSGSVGIGGTPGAGFAMDEGLQDVKNFLFYEMGPLTMLIVIGLIIFGLMMMFRYLFKGKGGEGGDGKFDWKRWIFILIIILAILILLMSVAGGIGVGGGIGGIPLPGGMWLFVIIAIAVVLFFLYLMFKYGGFGLIGKAIAFIWNNIAKHGVKWFFTKAIPALAKYLIAVPFMWVFTKAVPWMWRGAGKVFGGIWKGVKWAGSGLWRAFSWLRGGRKLYIDVAPKPWKHFVGNVLFGFLNRIGGSGSSLNIPLFFKEGTNVPFQVRVRKAALWGRFRYRVNADVKIDVNVGELVGGPGATSSGPTNLEENVPHGNLGFVYRVPNTPGPLDMSIIASAPNSITTGKVFKYNIGGAGVRRLPNVRVFLRDRNTNAIVTQVNVGQRVNVDVIIASPPISLGSVLPAGGSGINLTLSGLPTDQVVPNTNPNPTVNFRHQYVFSPNATSGNQQFNIKIEATHTKFVGTASGFAALRVNPAPRENMRILVGYLPTVVPGGSPSIFAIAVVNATTGVGVDGIRVTCKQDGQTDRVNTTSGGGTLGTQMFAPPTGATSGIFTIKISAEDPRGTKQYNDVPEGSIDLQIVAPGITPTGVDYKVIS